MRNAANAWSGCRARNGVHFSIDMKPDTGGGTGAGLEDSKASSLGR